MLVSDVKKDKWDTPGTLLIVILFDQSNIRVSNNRKIKCLIIKT